MPGRLSVSGNRVNPLKITKKRRSGRLEEISALELAKQSVPGRRNGWMRFCAVWRSCGRRSRRTERSRNRGAGLSDLRGTLPNPPWSGPRFCKNAPKTDGMYFAVPKTVE